MRARSGLGVEGTDLVWGVEGTELVGRVEGTVQVGWMNVQIWLEG